MRYHDHLCAVDPEGFAAGFALARGWVPEYPQEARRVWRIISESTGRPWSSTAELLGVPATAHYEGFALGIYGLVALDEHSRG